MSEVRLNPHSKAISGVIQVPGDKSISHRAVILGSLAKGRTKVTHFLDGEDCMRTIHAFRALGVTIEKSDQTVLIQSDGFSSFIEPKEPLYFGNSGTTARLMLGILAGLPFFTTVYGDASLSKRPMNRVVSPLKQMGAYFDGRSEGDYLPISIRGGNLSPIKYTLPVKSAQVKSAILFAGLLTDGTTEVIEPTSTRDHTEIMLQAFGADVAKSDQHIKVTNKQQLTATDVFVPGDISSAAFFLVAAAIVPNSTLTLENVGLNKTRTGIIDVLKQMGGSVSINANEAIKTEPTGDITVDYSELTGITIGGDIIPRLIDELPIIALLATQAKGKTVIRDAGELRLKETDRIAAVVEGLSNLGARIEATEDGMIIHGQTPLKGGHVTSYDDHRIAMMAAISSLITKEDVVIDDTSSVAISYPGFFDDLNQVTS
ncbi:3-phosphoshikimate 1-carboxyvinyltransferase [Virgibacillus byunsanensis]|uniref:3-phosphoshikimate 1-carboxyvinyltransferase n=1 Tax=Virgibacillus byunsanensis TaxID=570945 RepID=A0ABW3LMW1_9BACI